MSNFPIPPRVTGRIGFDLDDTLADGVWPSPEIGVPIALGVAALLHYHDLGYELILVTARPASHAPRIWAWLEKHGLKSVIYDIKTDKPLLDMMVDDRALKFPEGFA